MSWIEFYNLLEKYDNNIALASATELRKAVRANSESPTRALILAKERYQISLAKKANRKVIETELLIKK